MMGRRTAFKGLAGELGLEELVSELDGGDQSGLQEASSAEMVFNAQQMVLTNIMVVSALLLGFIVTGTLLSIGLTGRDNFGISELIRFFYWSSLACMFAFVSLIVSFLTSVWGAHRMTTSGPVEAKEAMTKGSVLRRIVAEGGLYLSMFFFLVSLNHYIWMVYSGPDICPSYRGSASFCARQGADLYEASVPRCPQSRCDQLNKSAMATCTAETSMDDCLCIEVCTHAWNEVYPWSEGYPPSEGVSVYYYHFFGYRNFGPRTKPAREKVIVAASRIMCNHPELESQKDACFRDGTVGDCTDIYLAWKQAEDCLESTIQDADQCSKVCSWAHGRPPREALKLATDWAFIPLGVMLLVLTLGRVIIILARALAVFANDGSRLKDSLRQLCCGRRSSAGSPGDSDEESD